MLNAIFRPIDKWPGRPTAPHNRTSGGFQAKYQATLDLLEFELQKLRATNVVIQLETTLSDIRNDGWLKPGAKVTGPGVILSFTGNGEQYSYPCDTFDTYAANLRAIALALEALRKIDRYGVTKRGEQYEGFKQLPPGPHPTADRMTAAQAADWIAARSQFVTADGILGMKAIFEVSLRELQKSLHPDGGGTHDDFIKLQEAADALAAHHNAKGKTA